MSPLKAILTAGFAMFSMFFGSGNLVFPLYLGQITLNNYGVAIVGLIITAVIVPFLGLLGMILYNGDHKDYFSSIGKKPAFLLTLLMLCLMGPFGIMPRCIGVSFGGLSLVYPSIPLELFSALFCMVTTALIWNPNRVVEIIGIFLTPFKLGGIALLILVGLWFGGNPEPGIMSSRDSFLQGMSKGYQTMDLLASFFFACTIIEFLRQKLSTPGQELSTLKLFKYGIYAGLVGASLLSLAYTGFVVLGAEYGTILKDTPPESLLAAISGIALGEYAMPVVSFTIAISCLATATVVANLFAEFLKKEIFVDKISYRTAILITMVTTYVLSLLGFQFIMSLISMMLSWLYPLLIAYAVFKVVEGLKLRRANNTILE